MRQSEARTPPKQAVAAGQAARAKRALAGLGVGRLAKARRAAPKLRGGEAPRQPSNADRAAPKYSVRLCRTQPSSSPSSPATAPRAAERCGRRTASCRRRRSCRSARRARSRASRIAICGLDLGGDGLGAEIILGNTYHLYLRPGRRAHRARRRTPSLHRVEPADPDRQRRLSGVQPGGAPAHLRRRRRVSIAPRRLAAPADARSGRPTFRRSSAPTSRWCSTSASRRRRPTRRRARRWNARSGGPPARARAGSGSRTTRPR